jgi:large subunit ribosomal protein L9
MKVVLVKDVKGQGKAGDVVNVSDGYASNYLIPNGLAVAGTAGNLSQAANKKQSDNFKAEQIKQAAFENAKLINGKEVTIYVKLGDNGKLFGSVTSKEIADEISKLGVAVDKKKVELNDNIKNVGKFNVKVKLHPAVTAKCVVNVVAK